MCKDCFKPVFDPENLIDGLCDECVDKLLTLSRPWDETKHREPTKRSAWTGSLGGFATRDA